MKHNELLKELNKRLEAAPDKLLEELIKILDKKELESNKRLELINKIISEDSSLLQSLAS